jgi:hypothetical protein
MKRLILLLAMLGLVSYSSQALVQGTIKPAAANAFKITIKNIDPVSISGNFAQYNAAIRVAQTVPQPALILTNLLPVGSVTITSTYTSGIYTYYNIFFEAPTGTPNPVTMVQNAELDIFSGVLTNGAGSAQVDLVDTWMFTDATATAHTGTGTSQFTQFYINIQPSGLNGDATNYAARFYSNGQSTAATNATGTSFVGLLNVPLPVDFTHIEGTRNNNTAVINWGTAHEMRNAGFDVERSNDGKSFTRIGFQRSLAANGTSNEALEYSFADVKPLAGVNYYRVKQTDVDGQSLYSKVVTVAFDNATTVKVFPNPATSNVTVEAAAVKNISLINQLGQTVQAPVTYGTSSHTVVTAGLAKGTYTIRISTETGTTTQKLVIAD